MNQIFSIYDNFLAIFPPSFHGIISLILFILIVIGIIKIIQKDFIWLIVLIILLPASIPILVNLWNFIIGLLQFLLNKSSI